MFRMAESKHFATQSWLKSIFCKLYFVEIMKHLINISLLAWIVWDNEICGNEILTNSNT